MIYAVIAAGGIGSRMGSETPKQYLSVGGKSIISHTVEKFSRNERIDKVIVLCPDEWVSYTKELINSNEITVISGGETRNETLMKAIDYIESTDGLNHDTILVTHDAVRPFVTDKIINDNIDAVLKYGATGTAIAAVDTIFETENGEVVTSVPDRSKLYQAQTPQCFGALTLRELYNSLSDSEKEILTDACKIFTIKGYDVHIVKGDVSNIKITYPYDLIVAEAILKK